MIPDDHSMVSLLGSGDELLHVIEDSFDADIHVRGNEITITGTAAETAVVAELFEEITALLAGGAELTPAAVERIMPMLRRKSGVRPAEVLSLDILSSRGRTIRPKTLNQKRYVDAIDEHTIVFCIGPAGTGKTYLAMAKAVKALQAKEVDQDHPHPARGGGRRAPRFPARHPVREDRPVPAPVVRRAARHAGPGVDPAAHGRRARSRSRRWPTCAAGR